MRLAAGVLAAALASAAPMQCGSSRDPDLRRSDSPGDALWDLASTFEKEGNLPARDRTYRYLVTTYPSNRHVPEARQKLGEK